LQDNVSFLPASNQSEQYYSTLTYYQPLADGIFPFT